MHYRLTRREFLAAAGAGLAGALAAACAGASGPVVPAGSPVVGRSSAGAEGRIRLAHQLPPQDLTPVLFSDPVRQATGMSDYGVAYQLELQVLDGAAALQALASGQVDLAVTDLPSLIRHVGSGGAGDLRIVAALLRDGEPGYRSDVFRIMADTWRRTPRDFRQRTITGGPAGSLHELLLRDWLREGGVEPDEVEWAALEYHEIGNALRASGVVLGPLVAPYDAFEAARGGMMNLFTVADRLGPQERLVLTGRAGWLVDNRAAVEALLRDRQRSQAWVLGDGREASVALVAEVAGLRPGVVDLFFAGRADDYRPEAGCVSSGYLEGPAVTLAALLGIERAPALGELVDPSYLPGPCPA